MHTDDLTAERGPVELGRGVIINADGTVPDAWSTAPVIDVHGVDAVPTLHDAWLHRHPIVVRLQFDPASVRAPWAYRIEPWKVEPSFDAADDRLHFLLWANNYDARTGETIWWWSRKAERLGARPATNPADGDVEVNGHTVWIDGGPRQPLDLLHIHRETIDLGRLTIAPAPANPHPEIPLAHDQMAAVSHDLGPARIIAPAGSGKTRVLTERLRYLLGVQKVEPESVVAIAYNKKAQEELSERTRAFRPRVVTLNALGWELLGRPAVVTERDVRRIVERLVPTPQRRSNVDPIGPYLEALSRIRLGLMDPVEVEDERDDVPGLADAFDPFREALKEQGVVDFDEQIYSTVERLLADGEFRRASQARFRHLLVDEFQDLTPAHVLMVRLLSMPELDVFGVGDDDQVIYGHAGADPQFLVGFADLFPGAASHPLVVNYRCPVEVVHAAKHLLSYNRHRVVKEIEAGPHADPAPDAVRIMKHESDRGGESVVEIVRQWIDDGVEPTQIAVLTRVNSLLLAPQVALATAGVPVATTLDERVLDRTGARAALAYLRIATADEGFAKTDLMEVLRRPSRGLPIWIEKWFRTPKLTVRDLRAIAPRLDDAKVTAKLDGLADDLEVLTRAASRSTTRQLLKLVKDQIGLGQAMGLLDAASAASSHLDDLEALEQVADLHPDPAGFEPWLRATLGATSSDDGVTLATIHRVKGQEWPMVILFGVNDGLLPHRLTDDVEEERRVLHVGITRAHRRAVLLADTTKPSAFLNELDGSAPRSAIVRSSSPNRAGLDQARAALGGGSPGSPSSSGPLTRAAQEAKAAKGGKAKKPKAPKPAAVDVDADPALVTALREWRSQRAKRDGVPPYVILHDHHLVAIAAARPATLKALSLLDGMGPRRLELYGDELLSITTG